MFCEICGREIVGKPARSLVEGARLIVCQQCSSLGTRLPSFPDSPARPVIAPTHTHAPIEKLPKAVEESDLIEEYPTAVKEARAKLGLSQQDLAFKAKEKVTVIQKIEIGKMLPTMRLAKELEHILRIRLLVPRDELDIPAPPRRPSPSPGVTLGDVAVVRHKEGSDE
ncbi:TIGR00270 family protein [Candidatus Bathyarchaeota archaeon]|nr:MAG: TIGR00270 family protein [Candidatus Bathyarchaeota archaeon]